ncbi:hypothetical protein SAMD00019534_092800 [Acytostelium subglobosum LB1]|uniref:hypothetical protein n=1 Tax=Acytostelium subglobosum LB1 TaxID=1410327 RepID=UPI000644AFC1|nr:hypothetical protein SAMD00019534_092800 [Acytostelium subglobosum LB1]GAM26105.1 hypothetical protein SAMD00019534_092800 [Acytostelium subglobosum LB1]|eukprot:XP_012751148.1 hypothetical protein SAMD00019534_092800 [Acytostelium subglobosum LB1]
MNNNSCTYDDGSTPNITIVGAGFSGICAAIKLKKELSIDTFTIYDLENDLGGTWMVNSYPGCACDVPSHLYSFSFELNPDWSEKFSPAQEIQQYIVGMAKKYDLYKHIQFQTAVHDCQWDDALCKWIVQLKRSNGQEETIYTDILLTGAGALRIPNIPEVFKQFQGPMCHSAQWDNSLPIDGKNVAIIGNGASAVQIIPEIAPRVKSLSVFQRHPSWIIPRANKVYSGFSKWIMRNVPLVQRVYRWLQFISADIVYGSFVEGSTLHKVSKYLAMKHLTAQVKDEALRATLTPSYSIGCKRIIVSDDFYPALGRSNVTLETDSIDRIEGTTIITREGTRHTVDSLILATGFRVQDYCTPMNLHGKGGVSMRGLVHSKIETYLGICVKGFPNSFVFLGPNTALGHNSVLFMIECQVNFTMQCIREMIKRNMSSIDVQATAQQRVQKELERNLEGKVWTTACGSWYNDKNGHNFTIWPGSCTNYWWRTRTVDFRDFNFTKASSSSSTSVASSSVVPDESINNNRHKSKQA